MRIGLGLVLLCDVLPKWPHVATLYSSAGGPMPFAPGTMFEPIAMSPGWAVAAFGLLVFLLLCVTVGWKTRWSLAGAFVLFTWFGLLDIAGTFKKYSVISQHLLVLLMFTQSHATWSFDALRHGNAADRKLTSPIWPRLLMRFLISLIYVGAVITKVRLPDFGTGDLLIFSLFDHRWGGGWLGMWIATHPTLVMFLSYATTLFEMSAALLLWVPAARRIMIVLAMGFHLSLGVCMHIGVFSPLMIVALLAFVEERDLDWIGGKFRCGEKSKSRMPPSWMTSANWHWVAYGLAGCVFTVAGFAQQFAADPAGVFQAKEAALWKELDDDTVADITAGVRHPVMRMEDYFHRIELGSRLGYRQVFGESKKFRRGQTVFIMARLQQSHPRMELRWRLVPPKGVDETRHTRGLNAQFAYAWFGFRMTDQRFPTGDYAIILEANGEEVARRQFELVDE